MEESEEHLAINQQKSFTISVGDRVVFEGKNYEIYQIQIESRMMLRLFLKESNIYEG